MENEEERGRRLPPGVAEQFARQMGPVLAAWGQQFAESIKPVMVNAQKLVAESAVRTYKPQIEQFLESLAPILERIRESLPPNWPREPGVAGILELAKTDELPTAWVPNAEILTLLMAADDFEQRLLILSDRRVEIAEDCLRVLSEVEDQDLSYFVDTAVEAAETLAEGRFRASQALSAAVLSGLTTERVAATLSAARKALEHLDLEDALLVELSSVLALIPVRSALSQFAQGGPQPRKFNRHASVHTVDPVQYTAANAAIGLLTVVSFLRQESFLAAEDDTSD